MAFATRKKRTLMRVPLGCLAAVIGLSVEFECAAIAQEIVTLTMQERIGLPRKNEPVVIGVPFPAGSVKTAAELALASPAGGLIPCEFYPVVKWSDGTIRWTHLYFLGDCPASGKSSVKVVRQGGRAPSKSSLTVDESVEAYTVGTGPLKFVVKRKGFNLIDSAWINGKQVIAPHKRGAIALEKGVEYAAALDPDVKVEKEEAGPRHIVIKATGAHISAAGEKRLNFVTRIYAYSDSPVVRISHTFIMAQGQKIDDYVQLEGLHLEFPTVMKDAKCLFGSEEKAPKSSQLARGGEAYVLCTDSESIKFGGAVSGESKGKSIRPRKIGWADLSDGFKGLAAGVRWFWQMHPKSIELSGDGLVRVGLYPSRAGKSEKIYSGVARTHYIQLVFHEAPAAADLAAQFAGLEFPLLPFAPQRWYCRDTKAFGNIPESDPSVYKPEYRAIVENWDKAFEAAWAKFDKMMDGRTAGGGTRDDYGMLEWGDNFHYTKNAPWGRMFEYNGNYYGYPHMMALQFIRTGNLGYFDHFERHACHVADVHTAHYDPSGKLTGASRYCPPGEHVRFDDYQNNPPKYPVYISNTFNHFKNEELFERWYFLADHRMRDVLAEQRRLVIEYKSADKSGGQPRGAGHLLITLAKFYEDTLEPVFLERAKEVFNKNKDIMVKEKDGKPNFQQGIQLEGVRRYYEISGDPAALEYFQRWADCFLQTGAAQPTAAQAFGLLYSRTGDRKYLDLAIKCVSGKFSFSKEKDFALAMRNGPYFFYFLSNDAPAPKP